MAAHRFAIMCVRRTGSNHLCGLLNSHPQVLCHAELFNPTRAYFARGCYDGRMADLEDVSRRDADPLGFLEQIWARDFGHAAVGFKLLDSQEPRLTAPLLQDPRITVIVLERRNRMRAYVSWLRANLIGRCAHRNYDGLKVEVRPKPLITFVNFYNRYYDAVRGHLRKHNQPWVDVFYEDLAADPRASVAPIFEALGLQPELAPLIGYNRRQSHDRLEDIISNYRQIAYMLQDTPLAADLREAA